MAENGIASVFVTILPETSRVAEGIRRALRDADKDVREAGQRYGRELERGMGDVKVKVKADTAEARAEIDRLDDRDVTVKVKADTTGLPPLLGGGGSGGGFGEGGGGGALKLNLGLTGIGLLPAASTAIANVAGSIQQLAGAGLVLPGVFAGLASTIGVAKIATMGMDDAFKALDKSADGTKASVDAANKALAGLAPNAADTVKTVYGLKGTFTDLQHLGSQNLFSGVSGGLKALVRADLPAVTKGIDGISRSLNQNLLKVLSSAGSSSSQGFLTRIFGNTAGAQSQLTAAIDPIVHAVGTLAAAGSDSLPRLATAIGNVADRFNAFITTADANGNLHKWISDGLDGFTHLGNIVLDLGKGFEAITQAAGGGGGLLTMLQGATDNMVTFLNSASGKQELIDFFHRGAGELGQLMDIAKQVGPILNGAFQSGLSAANLWLPVIREILEDINAIPGGAQTVVTAFVAWKTIQGPVQLLNSVSNISNALGLLPGAATASAGGIGAAFSALGTIAIPIALIAAGGIGADWLSNYLFRTDPLGSSGFKAPPFLPNTPTALNGQPVPGSSAASPIPLPQLTPDQKTRLQYQGIDPATARPEDVYKALGLPVPAPPPPAPSMWGFVPPAGSPATTAAAPPSSGLGSGSGLVAPIPTVAVPSVSSYVPPVVTQAPTGGSTPNLPYTGTADAYAGTAMPAVAALGPVYTGAHTSDTHGELVPNAANLKSIIEQMFPAVKDIGGYRAPDGYNEHSSGEALDIMVGANKQLGDQINQFLLQNANALGIQYDLWQQTQWNPDGTTSAMSDRGGATANHRDHVHARVRPGPVSAAAGAAGFSSPMDPMYSGMSLGPSGGGLTSQDLSLRNAQQRINDTQQAQEQAEARLNELRAKGTATDRQMEAAEYAVAKAKREHQDAIDGLTVAQDKYNKSAAKGQGGDSDFQSLGGDLFSGALQAIGLDGTLFKNPFEGGLWKGFTGVANFVGALGKAKGDQGDGGAGGLIPGAGGGDLFSGLLGLAQNVMPGAGNQGDPQAANGMPHMPGMPDSNSPNIADAAQFKPPGGPASPGPGNAVDNSINVNGPVGLDPAGFVNDLNGMRLSQTRWAPLAQNLPR